LPQLTCLPHLNCEWVVVILDVDYHGIGVYDVARNYYPPNARLYGENPVGIFEYEGGNFSVAVL